MAQQMEQIQSKHILAKSPPLKCFSRYSLHKASLNRALCFRWLFHCISFSHVLVRVIFSSSQHKWTLLWNTMLFAAGLIEYKDRKYIFEPHTNYVLITLVRINRQTDVLSILKLTLRRQQKNVPLIKDLKQMVTVRMEFFHTFIKNFFIKFFQTKSKKSTLKQNLSTAKLMQIKLQNYGKFHRRLIIQRHTTHPSINCILMTMRIGLNQQPSLRVLMF